MGQDQGQPATQSIGKLLIPGARIQGGAYAAINTTPEGRLYALIWLDKEAPAERLNCDAARAWCKSVGGEAPTRAEALQLLAVFGKRLPQTWIWTAEDWAPNPSASAWLCTLLSGVGTNDRSAAGGAVAVRRLFLDSLDSLLELAERIEVSA